jgi:branched-chain amino acid transport system substrate-binding protein
MKRRVSFFLIATILAGVLAACGAGTTGGGGAAAPTPAGGGAAAPTAAPAPEATAAAPAPAATSAPAAGGGETIRIYSSLPRQGSSKVQTDSVVNAIKMRLEEDKFQVCNGQFKIDYQDLDDATAAAGKWDPATETANANKAVSDPDAMVYIGTFNSGAAKLSIPLLGAANMVMISPANTYLGLTKPSGPGEPDIYYPSGKRNYVRVVTADHIQGEADAKWAQELGAKKVYILDDQEAYGAGVANEFEKNAKASGLEILGHEGIDPKAANYTSLMTKIKDKGPDLVYFGGIEENHADQLIKDLRAVGMTPDKVKFLGPDGILETTFVSGAGADVAEGSYGTAGGLPFDKLGSKGQDFLKKYKDKYGLESETYGPFGYEAASVVLAALNKVCKKDRAAILDAVFNTKDFDGVLGKWSFDKDGDTTLAAIVGYQVKNGKWESVNFFTNGKWEK